MLSPAALLRQIKSCLYCEFYSCEMAVLPDRALGESEALYYSARLRITLHLTELYRVENAMGVINNWEANGLYIQYIGHVSGAEMLAAALEVSGDPRFDDIRYVLSDWRQATETSITPDHIRELVAYVNAMAKSNPKIKNATVMYDDEERKAKVALYGVLAEDSPWQIDFFDTIEEARAWINAS